MIIWWLELQLPVQSVPIAIKVVSLNPAHGEVYLIQHYVIKFVTHFVNGFSLGTLVSSTNKTDSHDIIEILLKVVLKHHNPNPIIIIVYQNMKLCSLIDT